MKQTVSARSTSLRCDRARLHEPFPLSDVQHAYWIGRQGLYPLSNIPTHFYLELDGELDPARLDRAWAALVALHPMLRVEFLASGEQRIMPRPPRPNRVEVVDLRTLADAEREQRIAEVRRRMSGGAPAQWPHVELLLHLLPGGRTRLHFNIDMLLVDAYSVRLLFKAWGRLYADPRSAVPLDVTFRDYQLAERELLAGPAARASRAYWSARAETLPMPPDLPRALAASPATLSHPTFAHRATELAASDWASLKLRASEHDLTAAAVLAAAFAETLAVWSAEPRFTINATMFRRFPLHRQVNEIIGDFTSTLLLGHDWGGGGSFLERARRGSEQMWRDMDHPYVGGVEVLRQLSQARGQTVLNPIVFTCALGDLAEAIDWAGDLSSHATETSQVALDNRMFEYRGRLVIGWDTVDELYPSGLMDEMHAHYLGLLRRLGEDDEAWTRPLPRLPAAQLESRLVANATDGPVAEGLLQSLVMRAARRQPERTAIIAEDRTVTYGELLAEVTALAAALARAGAAPGVPVGVVTRPGWERVVAPLGVLEAGAPYVPVDPDLPAERLRVILEDAGATLVVTTAELDRALSWPAQVRRVLVDRLGAGPDIAPRAMTSPGDIAYICYTSGTTGRPKGVAIDHRGPLNTITDMNERFGVGPDDRVLALSNLSFDLSVYDIFGVLGAGGTVVYPPRDGLRDPAGWAELVSRHRVTLWNTVPLLYGELVDAAAAAGAGLESLRLVLLSGDWIPLDLPRRSRALRPDAQLVSLGGATEASIWSIIHPIGEIDPAWRSIPYGKPLRNQRFHVLNEELQSCPDWVEGDLFIAGMGLAQGYWRDEERTRASFLHHPGTGERLYRTGDRGRYLPDGSIELLGRRDGQVKIRGFRVELGEVESHLRAHPDVRECFALLHPPRAAAAESARQVLVAYVVPAPGRPTSEAALLDFVRERLPDYMVPGRVVAVDAIPMTANGKVDRRALPPPDPLEPAVPAPPASDLERSVAAIWSEVLGIGADRLDVGRSFFDLGGNSILLARLHRRLAVDFADVPLQLIELFEHQTIAGQAHLLEGAPAEVAIDLGSLRERVDRKRQALAGRQED